MTGVHTFPVCRATSATAFSSDGTFRMGIPQAMFAQCFYAGTVCDIVQIVFPAIHGLNKVLVDLRDERKGSLPVGCFA